MIANHGTPAALGPFIIGLTGFVICPLRIAYTQLRTE